MPGALRMVIPEDRTVKDVVRIAGMELKGNRPIVVELVKLPGVNWRFAHAVCIALGINKWQALGSLTEEELNLLEDCLKNPEKYSIPKWLLNRRRDPIDGKDKHIVGADWHIQVEFDRKREVELGTWKGDRIKHGLPVRGQKTRSHHRKGRTIGVQRSKK